MRISVFFFVLICLCFGCKKSEQISTRLDGEIFFQNSTNREDFGRIFFDYDREPNAAVLTCFLNRSDETFVFESDIYNFGTDTVNFRSNCFHTDDGDGLEPHNEIRRDGQLQIEFAQSLDWWSKFDECFSVRFSIPVEPK